MPATLIITVYKDYLALERVLDSVLRQSQIPNQIILAHDTIDATIQEVIDKFTPQLNITYINQEDTGFNKNRILNKAILAANNDRIIFIDGDCILHPKFIEAHRKGIKEGIFTAGRRLDLDFYSSETIRKKGINTINLIKLLWNKTKRIEEGFYLPFVPISSKKEPKLLGCNMGWHKNDLIALNGFDMDYSLPGFGEDTDIEFRAKRKGLISKNMRWRAIQYHLYHDRPDREKDISQSYALFQQKKERGYYYCENGISTLMHQFPHE